VGPDGTVYVGADDGGFYAINRSDGSTKWKFQTGGAINGAPAISSNGLIYFGSMDGVVYVLDLTGKMISSYRTDQPIEQSSPAIAKDGTVYIGSRDNNLYAFKEGGPTPAPTSAATAVPAATATPAPPPTPSNPAIAADGQTLAGQPPEVQQIFQAAFGDAAAVRWAQEHNASIGRG
jgi:hypothetical protein